MKRASLILLLMPALLPAAPLVSAGDAPPTPEATLTAIEQGPGEGVYTLICEGSFRHRLARLNGGLLLQVELPGVLNTVTPDRLPPPVGLVKGITIRADGNDSTRVVFALDRPAPAVATVSGRGLRLQFGGGRAGTSWAVPGETPVGSEDLLEINVFEIPELNRTVRVSARGTISLPLLGEMMVDGLSPVQLEKRLREELEKKYLQDPQVSVFVREHGSRKVSVLGAVGKPGVYEMLGARTLLQVLSMAGGLTKNAGVELYIVRGGPDGSGQRITINVSNLMSSADPELNQPIQPGDIVSVPIDRPIYIYVDGAVKKPGRIEQPASRPITLLQAIAKAGGMTERAKLKDVQILRQGEGGKQTVLKVNLKRLRRGKDPDPTLREGDIVVVPETFF